MRCTRRSSGFRRLIVGAVLVAVTAAACSGQSDLDILRADPLADVELSGALDTRVAALKGGTALGIDSPGQIQHTFVVPAGEFDSAIEKLADMARAAGWTLDSRAGIGYSGEKTIQGRYSQVTITGTPDSNTVWVLIYTRGS